MHTTTQHLIFALWDGLLDVRMVLQQLTDRHYAQGPEPDVQRDRLVQNCRHFLRIRSWLNVVHIGVLVWVGIVVLSWVNNEAFERSESELVAALAIPYLLSVALEFSWMVYTNRQRLREATKPDESVTDQLPPAIGQTVVVYSGFVPFSAFGISLESWSVIIDTSKTVPTHREPEKFLAAELLSSLSSRLQGLLLGARVQDLLFVRGAMLSDVPGLLANRTATPNTTLDSEQLSNFIEKSDPNARLYRSCVQRIGSSGTLFTAFIRVYKRQAQLIIECHQYLLPDLRADFRKLDDQVPFRPLHFIAGSIGSSLVAGPLLAIVAIFSITASILRITSEFMYAIFNHPLDKQKRWSGRFDYGHRQTIRSKYSAAEYDTFFQTQDKEALRKATNIAIVNELASFLKSKGVDVGDLESSKQQIINSGVFVAGGTFNSAAFASGEKAHAAANVAVAPPRS